jgi:spermidine/putrescine transport system ATP-binding protein
MNAGRIEQTGAPRHVYSNPQTTFVAEFLGLENLIRATLAGPPAAGIAPVETDLGRFDAAASDVAVLSREQVAGAAELSVLIRPEAAREALPGETEVVGILESVAFRGATQELRARVGAESLTFVQPTTAEAPAPGSEVRIALGPATSSLLAGPKTTSRTDHSSSGVRNNDNRTAPGSETA